MKSRPAIAFIPQGREDTLRQEIVAVLKEGELSAKAVSQTVGASEKEVCEHLAHIQKSAHKKTFHLVISPARCKKCGFTFRKREKLRKPGKCPLCRGESISEPLFSIRES